MDDAVAERGARPQREATRFQQLQIRVESDPAEGDDDLNARQRRSRGPACPSTSRRDTRVS